MYFSQFSRLGSPRSRCLRFHSGEGCFPVQRGLSSGCILAKRVRELYGVPFIRALTAFMRAYDPIISLRPNFLILSHWGSGLQHMNLMETPSGHKKQLNLINKHLQSVCVASARSVCGMDTTTERPGLMELASQGLENTVSEAIREEFISRKSRIPHRVRDHGWPSQAPHLVTTSQLSTNSPPLLAHCSLLPLGLRDGAPPKPLEG